MKGLTSGPEKGNRGRSLQGFQSGVRYRMDLMRTLTPERRANESVREKSFSTRSGVISTQVFL